MTDKYAVFLDIDGTLAYTETFLFGSMVSERNVKAIEEVRKLGHYVFINTGRSYGWIPKEVLNCTEYDGVVSGVGTSVIFKGENLYEDFIDRKTIKCFLERLLPTGKTIMLGGTEEVFIANPEGEWTAPEFVKVTSADDFETKFADAQIQKIELFAPEITDEEKRFFEDNLVAHTHDVYIEGWNKGNSKSRAMLLAAEKLGIKAENCIAVGDSINDIDCMQAAGISVAMGNATDDVKAIATIVTDTCKNDGVAKALEKLILNF